MMADSELSSTTFTVMSFKPILFILFKLLETNDFEAFYILLIDYHV